MMMFPIIHAIWLVYPIFRHTQDFFIETSRRDVLDRRSSTASRYSVTRRGLHWILGDFQNRNREMHDLPVEDVPRSSRDLSIYIYVCMYVYICKYLCIYIIYMGNGESPTCTSINRHMEPQNCRIKQENQLPEPIFQVPCEV